MADRKFKTYKIFKSGFTFRNVLVAYAKFACCKLDSFGLFACYYGYHGCRKFLGYLVCYTYHCKC